MIEQLTDMIEEILKQDKMFSLGAKMLKKSVDALTDEGFSREESITIIASQGCIVKAN